MNETTKTLTFLVAGAAALAGAWFIESGSTKVDVQQQVNKVLNEDIDIAAPRRLKIVKFDRQSANTRQFEVAEVDGVWSIPSKENYPADATQQMAEAATCLMDRKILRVAGDSAESHEKFGVVDPTASNLNSKSTGVGTRVVMSDGDDNALVDMIIGREVKDSPGQYYVRNSNQDITYVVELDPSKLSTDFADWIEDDLLKMSAFDVVKTFINDYSAELGMALTQQGLQTRVTWDRRGEFTLGYDDKDSKWTLQDAKKFDRDSKEMVPDKLADDEELNQEKLNTLRDGMDDLLIVDVVRKPAGLSSDLKAGADFLNSETAIKDLMSKGFSPLKLEANAAPEILSSEGEVIATERDGVEYVLRFGQLQVQTDSPGDSAADDADADAAKGDAATAEAAKDKKASDAENLRRYLFVMARFNKDTVPQPKLMELPELPKEAEGEASDAAKEEAAKDDEAKADQPKEDDAKDDSKADEDAKSDEAKADEQADDQAKADDSKSGDKKAEAEAKAKLDAIIAKRKAIEAENQRLLDEYSETIKTGQKKVADLNRRFGDWYFVISNDVYKQIHLGRSDIIKKKEAPAAEGAAAAGASAAGAEAATGLPNLPAAGEAAKP